MKVRSAVGNKSDVIDALIEDPTKSVKVIAEKLGVYRQKVWREKTQLENHDVIWGYTAIVDESKINRVLYLIMMKLKPMNRETANLIISRISKHEYTKQGIRLLNVLYVNGEYDWIVMFSAPNHATARKYYDSLRVIYDERLLEKPSIVHVNLALIREGKDNPGYRELHDFVPNMDYYESED